jgi:acyl-CoA synthetase (AMP-forming)/AMP-acid ligase II
VRFLASHKRYLVERIRSNDGTAAIQQGENVLSYAALRDLLDSRAIALADAGVRAGSGVALLRAKSAGFVADYLAILAAGARVIPLDPATPPRRRDTFLELSRPDFLITAEDIKPLEQNHFPGVPEDGAFVYFTSGSTGLPKPVLGSAAALQSFVDWFCPEFGITPADRFAFSAGLSFEASLRDIFPPLCAGATLVIPSDDDPAAPEQAVRWLAENEITVVTVVPSVARAWLCAGGPSCPRVRLAVFLGEPLTGDLLAGWGMVFPHTADRVNSYGTTESGQATIFHRTGPQTVLNGRVPSGRPVPGTRYCFVDPRAPLTPESVERALGGPADDATGEGEIVIVSRACSHGYLGLPAENAARFASLGDGVTAYRTGDLGRRDANGDLTVIGRADDEVKINGVRVHPAEVTRTLREHPLIADVFVLAKPIASGDLRLTAFLVPAAPGVVDLTALRASLMELLPLAMIPSSFVQLAALPSLRTGKIDRAALLALPPPAAEFTEPRTDTERWVAGQLTDLLGARPVSASDDFFALGGDSLTATRLAMRVIHDYGASFSQRDVFAGTTVTGIASIIDREQLLAADPLELAALLDALEGESA